MRLIDDHIVWFLAVWLLYLAGGIVLLIGALMLLGRAMCPSH